MPYLRIVGFFILAALTIPPSALATTPSINLVPVNDENVALSTFVDNPAPWLTITAPSEQRAPFYVGATPREMALGGPHRKYPELPESLRALGERFAREILVELNVSHAELEAWPSADDLGNLTWTFARWRSSPTSAWQWLEKATDAVDPTAGNPEPFLPEVFRLQTGEDWRIVFESFIASDDLYEKPRFGDCVFTDEDGREVLAAWRSPQAMSAYADAMTRAMTLGRSVVARALPQPARFNATPTTFVIQVSSRGVSFPKQISWKKIDHSPVTPISGSPRVTSWPSDFDAKYLEDLRILTGVEPAVFPSVSQTAIFTRKNSADPRNQLLTLVDYLEARYRALKVNGAPAALEIRRQSFSWQIPGTSTVIPQANLLVVIKGSLPPEKNRPILLADHIDTAYSEDEFGRSGQRVSAPGATDNGTATATLLRAAEILAGTHPRHDIVLLHLTGEEFPGEDLGARYFLGRMLGQRRDFGGMVLLDMIGQRQSGDPVFQINPGTQPFSRKMAGVALSVAASTAPGLRPEVREPHLPESYLANTDGLEVDDTGFPVILFNQHINFANYLDAKDYHQTTDDLAHLDLAYATAIAKTAIETVARLAN